MTIWDRPGAPLDVGTVDLLYIARLEAQGALTLLEAGEPPGAARRASRAMLRTAQALVWEEHRLRFRVTASYHAAFWDRFARPGAGRVAPELHRWLLEAYALCGRAGEDPPPRITAQEAAAAVARARRFLTAAHRALGLRPPFPEDSERGGTGTLGQTGS